MVQITSNGKESNAQVVDTCTGCGQGDLCEYDKIGGLVQVDS